LRSHNALLIGGVVLFVDMFRPKSFIHVFCKGHERAFILPGSELRNFEDCFQYGGAKTPDDYKRLAESFVPYTEKATALFEDFAHVKKLQDVF